MPRAKQLAGMVVGRGRVLRRNGTRIYGTAHHAVWDVLCPCGATFGRTATQIGKAIRDRRGLLCDGCTNRYRRGVRGRWFGLLASHRASFSLPVEDRK